MRLGAPTLLSALIVATGLSGCGEPTLDGSTDETFLSSVKTVMETLSERDRKAFARAVEGFEFIVTENALAALDDSTRIRERLRKRLDGLSAEETLELWNERLTKAIADLEEKKIQTDAALEGLKDVLVYQTRYFVQRGQRVVELKVQNKTEHTISKIYFHGVLTASDRRRPLVEDDFNYNIPKGLKPTEATGWNFALLSPIWKNAPETPEGLKLTVTVTRIDDEKEEPVYDALTNRFTKDDADRLEKLKAYQEASAVDAPNLTAR